MNLIIPIVSALDGRKSFLNVKVSCLNFSILHGKTDGTAVGFKWDLTKGHSGKLTKSSEVKCCECNY